MEEWNQKSAERRDLETMRRIAQDALEFGDDDRAFDRYAGEHMLTVNEIAYFAAKGCAQGCSRRSLIMSWCATLRNSYTSPSRFHPNRSKKRTF